MSDFFGELKRRNVTRVAIVYIIAGWLLMQVADVLLENFGVPEWGFRFITVLLLIGFPIALIFAWAFEITPEGVKRSEDVDPEYSITTETRRKLDYVIIVALVAALGVSLYFNLSDKEPGADAPPAVASASVGKSIAVLPFSNFSADQENEYFADGLSEELMNLLASIKDLRVAARTSSFYFKGKDVKVEDVGRELGVATVLEGSVRKSGDRVRVTAQLINVDDGFHMWSDTYDKKLDDIFEIQDEIAGAVVAALKVELLGDEAPSSADRSTGNVAAYDFYLLGRKHFEERIAGSLDRAATFYQQAIDTDPEYALALAGLAETYMIMDDFGGLDLQESLRLAEPLLEKALEINPDLPEVQVALSAFETRRGNTDAALESIRKAVEANPNYVPAIVTYANQLGQRGDPEAIRQMERAVELDPLSLEPRGGLAQQLFNAGQREKATELFHAIESDFPENARTYDMVNTLYGGIGDMAGMVRSNTKLTRLRPEDTWAYNNLTQAYVAMQDWDNARLWSERCDLVSAETQYCIAARDLLDWARGDVEASEAFWDARIGPNALPDQMVNVANVKLWAGKYEAARLLFERALAARGFYENQQVNVLVVDELMGLWLAYQKLGMDSRANELEQLLVPFVESENVVDGEGARRKARLAVSLGDDEEANRWIQRSIELGEWRWWAYEHGNHFQDLRSHPEFQKLVADLKASLLEQHEQLEGSASG